MLHVCCLACRVGGAHALSTTLLALLNGQAVQLPCSNGFACVFGAVRAQAAANFEFVLPLATVVVGVMPPSSQQYSVDLSAVPWLRLDTLNHRCETANL